MSNSGAGFLGLLLAPLGIAALDRASTQSRLAKQAWLMSELDHISQSEASSFLKEAIGFQLISQYDKQLASAARKQKSRLYEIIESMELLKVLSRQIEASDLIYHYKFILKKKYRFYFMVFSFVFSIISFISFLIFPPYLYFCFSLYLIILITYLLFEIRISSFQFPNTLAEAVELLRLPDVKR